jgi:hypothetical protein
VVFPPGDPAGFLESGDAAMETNLSGTNDDGTAFWAEYHRQQARRAAERLDEENSQRRLEACLLRWHEVFQASPGLLERMS